MKIHTDQLREKHARGLPKTELIVDVREPDEFAEGHIPGARNIPVEQVASHIHELAQFNKVYVHCGGGGRAGRAAEALRKAGLGNVVHVAESGMRSWVASGGPVEK